MSYFKEKIHTLFPTYGEKNIFWFYIVTIFGNAWFQLGNWLLFVLLFMGEREFAVYESVAFAAGILLEIPSGALADLFGRKRTVIIGLLMQSIGSWMFIFGYISNAYFFFGNLIIIMAFALISGSLEALVYDTLVESKKVKHFDDIIGKARSLNILSLVIASVIGGLLWSISIYGPLIATAASFSIALVLCFKLVEPAVDTDKFTFKNFAMQNKKGFYYLFKSDFRKYTFSFAIMTGAYLMWSVGIIRVLMGREYSFDGESLNYLIASTLVVGFFASYFFNRIRRTLGDLKGFGALILLSSVAWIVASITTESVLVGVVVFIGLTATGTLAEAWTSVILNKHVLSKDRATAISTLSFIIQIPYVLVVVLFGDLAANNATAPFYLVTGLLLIVGLIVFIRAEKSNVIVIKAPTL